MWYFFRKATCNLLEVVKKAAVVAPRNSLSSRRREGNGMNKGETQGTVYHMDEDQAENHTQHHIKCRKSWFKIFQHGDVSRLSRLIYYCRCSKGYCRIIIEPQEGRQWHSGTTQKRRRNAGSDQSDHSNLRGDKRLTSLPSAYAWPSGLAFATNGWSSSVQAGHGWEWLGMAGHGATSTYSVAHPQKYYT